MSKDWSAKCNLDNKERQQKKACERYQSLSKEEKGKKSNNMVKNTKRCKNLPADKKQKHAEHKKKYYEMRKVLYYNYKKLFF